jgi:hypothetical protein
MSDTGGERVSLDDQMQAPRGEGIRMGALKYRAIFKYNSELQLAQSLGTLQCQPRQQLLHSPDDYSCAALRGNVVDDRVEHSEAE